MSTAVSTAGQTMTEAEKSSDLGEISAVTVPLGQLPVFNAYFQSFVVPQYKNKKCKTNMLLAKLQ